LAFIIRSRNFIKSQFAEKTVPISLRDASLTLDPAALGSAQLIYIEEAPPTTSLSDVATETMARRRRQASGRNKCGNRNIN
jgi:hypothetical protein